VTHAAVLDIIPTYYLYTHVDIQFVQAYFHWFNYLRAAPGPENELLASTADKRRKPRTRFRSSTCAHPARRKTSTRCARTIAPAHQST
jgi:haloacetate dehalogenase